MNTIIMERKTEIGMPSSYLAPEVKVIPIAMQRSILTGSTGDFEFGPGSVTPGGGV